MSARTSGAVSRCGYCCAPADRGVHKSTTADITPRITDIETFGFAVDSRATIGISRTSFRSPGGGDRITSWTIWPPLSSAAVLVRRERFGHDPAPSIVWNVHVADWKRCQADPALRRAAARRTCRGATRRRARSRGGEGRWQPDPSERSEGRGAVAAGEPAG